MFSLIENFLNSYLSHYRFLIILFFIRSLFEQFISNMAEKNFAHIKNFYD